VKRALVAVLALVGLSACATGGGGGGGGGEFYTDCYTEYCIEYAGDRFQRLYLRTPGTPVTARGDVTTSTARGGTRVVTRNPASASVSPRMSPVPAARPSSPSGSGARRP
jgi:hypothetical protein